MRQFRATHPDYVRMARERQKQHRSSPKGWAHHAEYRWRKQGLEITPEDYINLLERQHGVCAICGGVSPKGHRLAVDHNHDTGYVRGLLCYRCNRIGLPWLEQNRIKALRYLDQYDLM